MYYTTWSETSERSTALAEVSLQDPEALLAALAARLVDRPFWLRRIEGHLAGGTGVCMHLAVFREPFLTLLLEGAKTIESRFSVNRVAPYACIARDDLILLKQNAGPVVGVALAGDPGFYQLDSESWRTIRARFAAAICAPDEQFWEQRARARYATLIPVRAPTAVAPLPVGKRDRRGWAVISPAQPKQTSLEAALGA
jgi:hypothetical protein